MNNISIQNKLNEINNTLRTVINNSNSIYSQHSKESEFLSVGSCSLSIESTRKSFIFKSGALNNSKIIISPLTHNIQNLEYINDTIKVSDLLTADAWFDNEKVKKLLAQYATKKEINENYGWVNEEFEMKKDIEDQTLASLSINSNVNINGTLNDINIIEILTPERLLSDQDLLDKIRGNTPKDVDYRLRVLEVDLHNRTDKHRIKKLEEFYG